MIHPHLKSHDGERFAVLLEPAVNVNNDVELAAAVTWHGRAVIVPFLALSERDSFDCAELNPSHKEGYESVAGIPEQAVLYRQFSCSTRQV